MTDLTNDPTVPDPAPYSQPAAAPPAPSAPSPSLSIISMILGILGVVIGFVGGGLLFSVGAVVLGHLGQRKEPEARGFWVTGLVTGYLGVVVNLIVIAIWIAILVGIAATPELYYQFDRWGMR